MRINKFRVIVKEGQGKQALCRLYYNKYLAKKKKRVSIKQNIHNNNRRVMVLLILVELVLNKKA